MAGGILTKKRYSPQAHEALNEHVNGLIHETYSVASVRQHIEESEDTAGTAIGVAPGAIDTAKTIVKEVLKTRLRESASDSIFVGSRKLGSDHLSKFGSNLRNAKDCRWLEQEIDFPEFSLLLKNFQVRHEASRASGSLDVDAVETLVKHLEAHSEPHDDGELHVPLTEATMAILLHTLLRLMQESSEACTEIVGLGTVHIVGRLFLSSDLDYKVQGPNPDHPEVQLGLAKLLAEIAYQDAQECCNRVPVAPRLGSSSMLRRSLAGLATIGKLPEPPPMSADALFAIRTLLTGLRQSLFRSEHAPVWAVIVALHRLVEQPLACRYLLESGIMPLLEQVREHYGGKDGSRLPVALPRPKPRPPTITKSVPNFIGAVAVPPALVKPSESVKKRFLVHSTSLPEIPRRRSIDFLAGTPKPQLPIMARSEEQPSVKTMPKANLLTVAFGAQQPSRKKGPKAYASKKSLAGEKDVDEKPFPSLLWLIGEDHVDKESYYRVCDKSFIMLQLQKLLWTLDKVRLKLPEIRPLEGTGSPSRGIMSGSGSPRSSVGRPRLSPLASPPRGTHELM